MSTEKYIDFDTVDFDKFTDYRDLGEVPFSYRIYIEHGGRHNCLIIYTKLTARDKDVIITLKDGSKIRASAIVIKIFELRNYNDPQQLIYNEILHKSDVLDIINYVKKDIKKVIATNQKLTEEELGYFNDLNKFLGKK